MSPCFHCNGVTSRWVINNSVRDEQCHKVCERVWVARVSSIDGVRGCRVKTIVLRLTGYTGKSFIEQFCFQSWELHFVSDRITYLYNIMSIRTPRMSGFTSCHPSIQFNLLVLGMEWDGMGQTILLLTYSLAH